MYFLLMIILAHQLVFHCILLFLQSKMAFGLGNKTHHQDSHLVELFEMYLWLEPFSLSKARERPGEYVIGPNRCIISEVHNKTWVTTLGFFEGNLKCTCMVEVLRRPNHQFQILFSHGVGHKPSLTLSCASWNLQVAPL